MIQKVAGLLLLAAFMVSCTSGREKYLTCRFNGTYFEADTAQLNANYIPSGYYLLLNGGGGIGGYISAQVIQVTGTGTYEVRDTNSVYMEMFRYYPDTSEYSTHPHGRIWLTIDELGTLNGTVQKARGSFYGVIYRTPTDSLVVSEGKFDGGV